MTNPLRTFQDALIVRNVVARFVGAMEHLTEEALKKYLHDHPNADPKDHKVKGGDSDKDVATFTRGFGALKPPGQMSKQERIDTGKKLLSQAGGKKKLQEISRKVDEAVSGASGSEKKRLETLSQHIDFALHYVGGGHHIDDELKR